MKKEQVRLYLPMIILFVVVNGFFIAGRNMLDKYGFSQDVLIIGNLILFIVTLLSLYFLIKGFLHNNVQVFFRSVYAALMIKMFFCAAAVIIYALIAKQTINKPALYICIALYFVYSFIEVRTIFRLLKQSKKNNE
jgi:hypothetical protein